MRDHAKVLPWVLLLVMSFVVATPAQERTGNIEETVRDPHSALQPRAFQQGRQVRFGVWFDF